MWYACFIDIIIILGGYSRLPIKSKPLSSGIWISSSTASKSLVRQSSSAAAPSTVALTWWPARRRRATATSRFTSLSSASKITFWVFRATSPNGETESPVAPVWSWKHFASYCDVRDRQKLGTTLGRCTYEAIYALNHTDSERLQ